MIVNNTTRRGKYQQQKDAHFLNARKEVVNRLGTDDAALVARIMGYINVHCYKADLSDASQLMQLRGGY